jgi:hypothetical protein
MLIPIAANCSTPVAVSVYCSFSSVRQSAGRLSSAITQRQDDSGAGLVGQ